MVELQNAIDLPLGVAEAQEGGLCCIVRHLHVLDCLAGGGSKCGGKLVVAEGLGGQLVCLVDMGTRVRQNSCTDGSDVRHSDGSEQCVWLNGAIDLALVLDGALARPVVVDEQGQAQDGVGDAAGLDVGFNGLELVGKDAAMLDAEHRHNDDVLGLRGVRGYGN